MNKSMLFKRLILIALIASFVLSGCTTPSELPTPSTEATTPEATSSIYETPEQEAVVVTAISYLLRGSRIQYDDTRLVTGSSADAATRYRWQQGIKTPEDYTSDFLGYTNCAAFTSDVYRSALNYNIGAYTTLTLSKFEAPKMAYSYTPTGLETDDEKASIEKEFRDNLKLGDIIVVRYNGDREGNGHAMLYVGEEAIKDVDAFAGNTIESPTGEAIDAGTRDDVVYDIIHSSGSSYSYDTATEKFESFGSIQKTSVDFLFTEGDRRYVYSELMFIGIVRPLATFKKEIPQETKNRVQNMQGILAEKTSSHSQTRSANLGDTVTFTFYIENTNSVDKTLTITDEVPANTTYLSGGQTVKDNQLTWVVTIPAKKSVTLSYSVKVNDDFKLGDYIFSNNGTVGGVSVKCPKIYVARTLTDSEQASMLSNIMSLENSGLRGFDAVNSLYEKTLNIRPISDNGDAVLSQFFRSVTPGATNYMPVNVDSNTYLNMLVPTAYGGRSTETHPLLFGTERTRLLHAKDLVVGDVIFTAKNAKDTTPKVYIFAGDVVYDLNQAGKIETLESDKFLAGLMPLSRFAVLRPSVVAQ